MTRADGSFRAFDNDVTNWYHASGKWGEERAMIDTYTAKYTKIASGYMGQLIEWPEIVTEGKDLEDCREMLRDAVQEMILVYKQQGREIPAGKALLEQIPVEV